MSFFFNLLSRSEVKKLIVRLNEEKKVLKKLGLTVDGKHYKVEFKGEWCYMKWQALNCQQCQLVAFILQVFSFVLHVRS